MNRIVLLAILPILLGLYQNCGGYQSSSENVSNENSVDEEDINQIIASGKTLYASHCAGCHGPMDSSTKAGRTVAQISAAIAGISRMNALDFLTPDQREAISAALIDQENGGGIRIGDNGHLEFSCAQGAVASTPLLKLTNRELRNALNLLLDDFSTTLKNDSELTNLVNTLPSDILLEKKSALKEQSMLVTQLFVNYYFNVAYRAGALIAGSTTGLQNYPNTNACLAAANITQACHQNFVAELTTRAYRRPVPRTESNAIAASFWSTSLTKPQLLQTTFAGIVLMPDFAYKIYDQGTNSGTNMLTINSHELASKVAFFITGAPPDATLRGLASSNQLADAQVLSQQVDRLLAQTGGRNAIQRMFRESYGYDVFDTFNYAANFLNGISTAGLQNAMTAELDNYFYDSVVTNGGTFNTLMTSRSANVSNAALASIYGSTTGAVTLPEVRSGFLNRAAMLAKRSGYRASPIKRGLHVLEHVLCVDVGLPPPDAPTSLPDFGNDIITTRESTFRTSERAGSACVHCHSRINNLGYPFEAFDTLGRHRTSEDVFSGNGTLTASLPVDTDVVTAELGSNATFADSVDLVQGLGQSDKAMMCFVQHLKEFEARTKVTASDSCQMNRSLTVLYGNNQNQGSVVNAIKAIVLSPEFRYWKY